MTAVLLAALAGAGLGACGGSHSSKPRSTTARAQAPKSTTTPQTTPTTPAATAPPTTTSTASAETPAQAAERERRHAALVAFVNCLRRQGYDVPEPDVNNHINTKGLPLKNSKFKSVGVECFENPNKPGRSK